MLLSVFTRHSTTCRFSRDRACRRCNCPKWVGGQVNGYYFRQSAKTRQWAEAEEVRVKLEEALIKGLPPFGTAVVTGSAPPIPTQADPPPASRTGVPEPRVPKPRPRVTVAQAVEAYLADAVSRSVESSTLKKLETIFRKQFLAWTRVEGIEYLDELELDTLLNFRNTWEDGPLAKQKKQSRVIGFFWACVRRRYLTENPAIGLGKIKVVQIPTDYFPPDEFERIIAAIHRYIGELPHRFRKPATVRRGGLCSAATRRREYCAADQCAGAGESRFHDRSQSPAKGQQCLSRNAD